MTLSAAEIAAQMTEGLDDSLQPIDDKAVVVTDDEDDSNDDETDDEKGTEDESDEDVDSDKDGGKEDDDSEDDDDSDAEEYSIDEVDVEDNGVDDEKEKVVTPEKPSATDNLTPEQKYIVENLAPIKLRGVVGDKEDVEEFTVYDPSQLPAGFKYLDDRERDMAGKAFNAMEQRAIQLQNDFRGQETLKAQKAYKEQEEKADWEDIASLQKGGELPKFKTKPNDPKFDEDPASVLIDKVLEFKDELNGKYLDDYNAGKPYRHIGFEDAYNKYLKQNPPVKKSAAEEKEDKDRKEIAKRTRGAKGDKANGGEKPVVLHNKREIDNYIESLDF